MGKFNWNELSSAQKDSTLNKVIRPYLDNNWEEMGWASKAAARKALKTAGGAVSKMNKARADSIATVKAKLKKGK